MEDAAELDQRDEQKCYAEMFAIPTNKEIGASKIATGTENVTCTYLCGNSLGVMPKRSAELVKEELLIWATRAVEGHFSHPKNRQWKDIADTVTPALARIIGAKENEVACMGTLTSNLHLLMNTFYKPKPDRYRILCEAKAFPSDQYAFASQTVLHGYDPKDAVLEMYPRPGEYTLRTEDILDTIKNKGSSIALVIFSGVQYYTGQWFAMQRITKVAQEQGCVCGWDLAHAVGNVPMSLHDWGVDFAVWCSYKYLNSGPGGIGGLFIHEKWDDQEKPRYAGWWGHDSQTRFLMPPVFSPIRGAQGYAQSNPSVLATVSLLGALQTCEEAGGLSALRSKSVRLTAYLEKHLRGSKYFIDTDKAAEQTISSPSFTIITPREPGERGAQLSLLFYPSSSGVMQRIDQALKKRGVVGDERQPDVIRLAPTPLYNTFQDCKAAALALEEAFLTLELSSGE